MVTKRWIAFALTFICIFSYTIIGVMAEEDLTVAQGCHSVNGEKALLGSEKLIDNASAVFMFETISQTVLYQWEADKQIYPASMVKIMTGLLVLENGDLSDTVIVNEDTLNTVSANAIGVNLKPGEQITVNDLMYCMLVDSANDASAVLAQYIAGSQDAFVKLMNNRAKELGCTSTVFTNAHGLHDDRQLMTARDLCKILNKALEYDAFRNYFGTIHYQVPATNQHKERNLSSNNYLMNKEAVGIYFDSRVTGGRTGITTEGYRNIVSLSESGNMEVICIVMESASELADNGRTEVYGGFPETLSLLNKAYDGYHRCQIIYPGQTLCQTTILNGDNDLFITSNQGFSTVLPKDISLDKLTFSYEDVPGGTEAPIDRGQTVASLQVWHGDLCIAQTDVYAMNTVSVATDKQGSYDDLKQSISWLSVALIVLSILIVGFLAYLIIARYRSKKAVVAQMRQHRRRRG